MNMTHSRPEIVASRIAAGALLFLLIAFAGIAAAQAQPAPDEPQLVPTAQHLRGVAKVTPIASVATAPVAPSINLALESLGMGDQVRVTVFRNPDLATEARVSERGTILFPLIGEVHVAGLTPAQAGAAIARKLRDGRFVVNPEVTVSLAQVNSRQVAVLGNVNKPGRYPIDSQNSKLTDFLAMAGGISAPGSEHVTLVSTKNGKTVKRDIDLAVIFRDGDLTQNVELQPGDTIYVEKAPVVYVYGEVQRGGAYRIEPNMTVMQALALGGGVTPRGSLRGIRIARRGRDGVHEMDARLTDMVQNDDVIYVRESLF